VFGVLAAILIIKIGFCSAVGAAKPKIGFIMRITGFRSPSIPLFKHRVDTSYQNPSLALSLERGGNKISGFPPLQGQGCFKNELINESRKLDMCKKLLSDNLYKYS